MSLSFRALRNRIDQARNSLCGLVRKRARLEEELRDLDDEDENDHERILQIHTQLIRIHEKSAQLLQRASDDIGEL